MGKRTCGGQPEHSAAGCSSHLWLCLRSSGSSSALSPSLCSLTQEGLYLAQRWPYRIIGRPRLFIPWRNVECVDRRWYEWGSRT